MQFNSKITTERNISSRKKERKKDITNGKLIRKLRFKGTFCTKHKIKEKQNKIKNNQTQRNKGRFGTFTVMNITEKEIR